MRKLCYAVMIFVLSVAGAVFAHEGREVGPYHVIFGWRVEPAYAGVFNGPEFQVEDEQGNPVEGLEETLQLEVSFGGATKLLEVHPVPDAPGHYTANLLPTLPGDYSFRLFGTIGDTEVDEIFNSADGDFSSVEPLEDIAFPTEMSLQARIELLEAQLAELMAQLQQ